MTSFDKASHEAARQRADAAEAEFWTTAAVTDAENTVVAARNKDLAEHQAAAYRRVAAARGRLTRARNSGDPLKIGDAQKRLQLMQDAADAISDQAITEAFANHQASSDRVGDLFDKMNAVNAGQDEVRTTLGFPNPAN